MFVSFTNLGRLVPAITIRRFCNHRVETIRMAQSGELLEVTVEEAQQLIRNHYAVAVPEEETEETKETQQPETHKRRRGRPARRRKQQPKAIEEVGDVNPV